MSDFVAPPWQKKKPWCDWDNTKKDLVYKRLAKIINENKRVGIAFAVPKVLWDATPERVRRHFGREHYTFVVRMCLNHIVKWRKGSMINLPVRYIFDWEMQNTAKRNEITRILELIGTSGIRS